MIDRWHSLSDTLSQISTISLKLLEQLLFFLCNVDVGILECVHFNVDVGHISKLTLKLLEQWWNHVHVFEWNLVDQLLESRVSVFRQSSFDVFLAQNYLVQLLVFKSRKLIWWDILSLRLNQKLVSYSKLLFDLLRFIKSKELALCHNTNPIGKLICFFEMLRAHDDGSSNFDSLNEFPGLSPRFNIESTGWLVKDNDLWLGDNGHSKWELSLHSSRKLRNFLHWVFRQHNNRKSLLNQLGNFSYWDIFELTHKFQMIHDSNLVKQDIKLLAKTKILLYSINVFGKFVAVNSSFSWGLSEHTCQHENRSCFSSSIMTQNRENFSLFDWETQFVDCGKAAEFLCQIIKSDWILSVVDFAIRLLLSNSCIANWTLSSGCPFLEAEARRFLHSVSIWHDLVEPNVDTEPHRNGKSQNHPAYWSWNPVKIYSEIDLWGIQILELLFVILVRHKLCNQNWGWNLWKNKEQVKEVFTISLNCRKIEEDYDWD